MSCVSSIRDMQTSSNRRTGSGRGGVMALSGVRDLAAGCCFLATFGGFRDQL
jgi:hypothetical protein